MNIKEFKCAICGKMFSELTPIHEKRCICKDCHQIMIDETLRKGVDKISMKELKKIAKKK